MNVANELIMQLSYADLIDGSYVTKTGGVSSNASFMYTDYIPIVQTLNLSH